MKGDSPERREGGRREVTTRVALPGVERAGTTLRRPLFRQFIPECEDRTVMPRARKKQRDVTTLSPGLD